METGISFLWMGHLALVQTLPSLSVVVVLILVLVLQRSIKEGSAICLELHMTIHMPCSFK